MMCCCSLKYSTVYAAVTIGTKNTIKSLYTHSLIHCENDLQIDALTCVTKVNQTAHCLRRSYITYFYIMLLSPYPNAVFRLTLLSKWWLLWSPVPSTKQSPGSSWHLIYLFIWITWSAHTWKQTVVQIPGWTGNTWKRKLRGFPPSAFSWARHFSLRYSVSSNREPW